MKVVDKAMQEDNKVMNLLTDEARIHAGLRHKNIVKIEKIFNSKEGHFCLVMELCPHGDLNKMLEKRKTLSEAEVLFFMKQLLTGLDFMGANLV